MKRTSNLQKFIYRNNTLKKKLKSSYSGIKIEKRGKSTTQDSFSSFMGTLFSMQHIRYIDITNNEFAFGDLACYESEYLAMQGGPVLNNKSRKSSQKKLLKDFIGRDHSNSEPTSRKKKKMLKSASHYKEGEVFRVIANKLYERSSSITYKMIPRDPTAKELSVIKKEEKTITFSKDENQWVIHFIDSHRNYRKEEIKEEGHIDILSDIARSCPAVTILTKNQYGDRVKKIIDLFDTIDKIVFRMHQNQESYRYPENSNVDLDKKIEMLSNTLAHDELLKIINLQVKVQTATAPSESQNLVPSTRSSWRKMSVDSVNMGTRQYRFFIRCQTTHLHNIKAVSFLREERQYFRCC